MAPECSRTAVNVEQSRHLKPSTKLEWIPFSAPAVAWKYFDDTSYERNSIRICEEVAAGRDLLEAYTEVSSGGGPGRFY